MYVSRWIYFLSSPPPLPTKETVIYVWKYVRFLVVLLITHCTYLHQIITHATTPHTSTFDSTYRNNSVTMTDRWNRRIFLLYITTYWKLQYIFLKGAIFYLATSPLAESWTVTIYFANRKSHIRYYIKLSSISDETNILSGIAFHVLI